MILAILALPLILPVAPTLFTVPVTHSTIQFRGPTGGTAGSANDAFAFVSNFENGALDGWTRVSGAGPSVVRSVNYSGEPSLESTAAQGPQVDTASRGFKTGAPSISVQVAINGGRGTGLFGLGNGESALALVGVSHGYVVAGRDAAHLQNIASGVPANSYPKGWVYLTANIYDPGAVSGPSKWVMQVFVDLTDQVAATISVPEAGTYTNSIIETLSGTVHYSDVVVSTYQVPTYIPGYNNMEGYGQGSGLLVNLLPQYYNLTAQMNLTKWSAPQRGILSFQINAMNYLGTTQSTCGGFFQIGVDLNPNGRIAPWYVEGVNCVAIYFQTNTPVPNPGIVSPMPTHLVLSIVYERVARQIVFTIDDTTIGQVFTASIPYGGTPFYATYTQMEFQPCCNKYPIQEYNLQGSIYAVQITPLSGPKTTLTSSYMLPFVLDAPPTWNFGYFQDSIHGYQQTA
jgi:hypothetical protein